jgi:uncharacterized protein YecT (DUF1311 family)
MRMMITGALLIGLAAIATAKADEKADTAAVKACLAEKSESPSACIGLISDPCQEKPEGQTTDGAVACVGREEAAWDAILNERYKAELAASKETEDDLKQMPDVESAPVVASLKEAQRAWIAYRDAECTRRYNLYQSGTYRFDVHAACQRDLTAERAINISTSAE